jgi:hypothetical protein
MNKRQELKLERLVKKLIKKSAKRDDLLDEEMRGRDVDQQKLGAILTKIGKLSEQIKQLLF